MSGEAVGLVVSFGIAAMFWMPHFRLFQFLRRTDVGFTLMNFALLFSIVVLPISTSFETSFSKSLIAELVLGGNLALISLMNLFLWLVAVPVGKAPLVTIDLDPQRLRQSWIVLGRR